MKALFALALVLLPTAAIAQDTSEMSKVYKSGTFASSKAAATPSLGAGPGAAGPDFSKSPSIAAKVDPTVLEFTPLQGVRRAVREEVADQLAEANPDQAEQIHQLLGTDEVWLAFEKVLARQGLSGRNMADVSAAYYVGAWEIVNRRQADPKFLRAVRNQLVQSMASSPQIAGLRDDEKQHSAESMGITAALRGMNGRALLENKDEKGYKVLQQQVLEATQQMGVDLSKMKLTDKGFVPS